MINGINISSALAFSFQAWSNEDIGLLIRAFTTQNEDNAIPLDTLPLHIKSAMLQLIAETASIDSQKDHISEVRRAAGIKSAQKRKQQKEAESIPADATKKETTSSTASTNTTKSTSATNVDFVESNKDISNNAPIIIPIIDCDEGYHWIIQTYHCTCPTLPPVHHLSASRKEKMTTLLQVYSHDEIEATFANIVRSEYLLGQLPGTQKTNFDWIIEPENFEKIRQNKYVTYSRPSPKKNAFNQFPQNDYDFDVLEKELSDN